MRLNFFFIFILFFAAELSSAAFTCSDVFRNNDPVISEQYVQSFLNEKLQPYFDQVSEKVTVAIIKKMSKRVVSGKINSDDLYKISRQYYRALQGNYFQSYVQQFFKNSVVRNIETTENFYKELENAIVSDLHVELKTNLFNRAKLQLLEYQVPLSWIKFLAINGAINWGIYNSTGHFLFMPVSFPHLVPLTFRHALSGAQKASVFYEGIITSLIRTYYSVALVLAAFQPEALQHFFGSFSEYQAETTNLQQSYDQAVNGTVVPADLGAKTHEQTKQVDAFFKKYNLN